jgi:hypothetical protein
VAGCCEHGNKPFGYLNAGEFLDELRDFLKKDHAPWS